jgi:hypothetical protein
MKLTEENVKEIIYKGITFKEPDYDQEKESRRKTCYAIKIGLIEKKPCEICGQPAVAHHEKYSNFLDVRWLCRTHHKIVHGMFGNKSPNKTGKGVVVFMTYEFNIKLRQLMFDFEKKGIKKNKADLIMEIAEEGIKIFKV